MQSDALLMDLFNQYVAWGSYANTELAAAEIAERKVAARIRFLESEHMVMHWEASRDKVTLAKAAMQLDPAIIEAHNDELQAYANRKLAQVMYENCTETAAALSRELSRRLGRDPIERRNLRWNP